MWEKEEKEWCRWSKNLSGVSDAVFIPHLSERARAHTHTHTHTHTHKYVILITFPRQQWLREGASMLRYTYIACVVNLVL